MEAVVQHRHPGSKLHFIGEGERQVGPVVDGRRAKEHTQLHVNEKEEENGESVRPCRLVCSSKRQRDESCKKWSKQGLRESRDRKSSRKRERERGRERNEIARAASRETRDCESSRWVPASNGNSNSLQ